MSKALLQKTNSNEYLIKHNTPTSYNYTIRKYVNPQLNESKLCANLIGSGNNQYYSDSILARGNSNSLEADFEQEKLNGYRIEFELLRSDLEKAELENNELRR